MNKAQLKKSTLSNIKMGKNVTIVEPSNIYDCTLSENTFVGPFVEIQKNVFIGKGTRIQSHSFICEMVFIGEYSNIGHGVMFINDTYSTGGPAKGNKNLWKETKIGNHVSIGSNSTILPVNICNNVVIGAGSVVTKNIKKSGVYAGNPAVFLRSLGS